MFASETMPHPLTQIEIVHRLRRVGFTQEQAEVQTQIITEVNENTLATKQDVQRLETKADTEFAFLRKYISDLKQEMRSEFVVIRKEMELLRSDILIKITVIMSGLLAVFGAVQKIFGTF